MIRPWPSDQNDSEGESTAILAESWENSSLTLLASSPLTTNPLQGDSPDLCVEKRQMVVYDLDESRKGTPEHEHRAPKCFSLTEGDNELQSVSAPQASTPLIHLSWNSPTASAEESFIDDGALGEGVDVSFVDTSFSCCSQLNTTGTLSEEDVHLDKPAYTDRKFIVFESNLRQLFRHCSLCGEPVVQMSMRAVGTAIVVTTDCMEGHKHNWHSQSVIRNVHAGNLLVPASVVFSGITFHRFTAMAEILQMTSLSESEFYRIQDTYVFPVIQDSYEKHMDTVVAWLGDSPKALIGDGRCDSPGHSAKYGTYTLMDQSTGAIVDFQLVQVSEVPNSSHMEKVGLHRAIEKVKGQGLAISTLATDRHPQVSKYMREEHPDIDHQFDVWHLSKGVVKKLTKKAKSKKCSGLMPWIKSISNHLWWSAATCNGNPTLLKEKWISILHHITNKHSWSGSQFYKKCCHAKLTAQERKHKNG